MSLEVIEMMIKESLRDGEISASERETIVKQGESLGISKEIIINLMDETVNKEERKKREAETAERSKELADKQEFERIKNYDHDKEKREIFKEQKGQTLWETISENKGKMPKKEILRWIDAISNPENGWKTMKWKGKSGKSYEFPCSIGKEWLVAYIKELEKEYSDRKKLAGGEGFIDKIKGLFKK